MVIALILIDIPISRIGLIIYLMHAHQIGRLELLLSRWLKWGSISIQLRSVLGGEWASLVHLGMLMERLGQVLVV